MSKSFSLDEANHVAVRALEFLAADEDRLTRFLALSGLSLDGLREAAGEPLFLREILRYLLEDEPSLLAFAEDMQATPELVVSAARTLGATPWERDTP